jgi:hypothetical protein
MHQTEIKILNNVYAYGIMDNTNNILVSTEDLIVFIRLRTCTSFKMTHKKE